MPKMALTITNFILANGLPVADGEAIVRLSKDCTSEDGQVSTRLMHFDLDSNGAPIGSPLFWPNSELMPNDSMYLLSVRNAQGERILGPLGIYVGPAPGGLGFGGAFGGSFAS